MKIKTMIILHLLLLILAGCSTQNEKSPKNDKLVIYTSIYPIAYVIERIGEESVTVSSIYPPGVDAHTYEPTMKVMTSIAKSDAFIYLGAGMEGFAETAASALATEHTKLIEIGKHEELFHSTEKHHHEHHDDGHNHGDHNPHIWLDPIRLEMVARIIKDELIQLNPAKANYYNENYHALREDLLQLDKQYKEALKNRSHKKILVSHAAFGYWEERYGIEQIAINGISSSNEPSQHDLVKIVEQAKQHKLHYIIFEQNTSNRISEIVQAYISAEAVTIHNLAVLTEQDINNNEDYLSLMEKNLDVLQKVTN